MSVVGVVAVAFSAVELVLAGVVFVRVADSSRSVMLVDKIPLPWLMFALFSWSILTGVVLQLGAVGVTVR